MLMFFFSGADLAALLREACLFAMQENQEKITPVSTRHFELGLTKVHPSVSEKEVARYAQMASELPLMK
jgi:SpoVK/Ycf46/Vps4 family AAA+-type ATPase